MIGDLKSSSVTSDQADERFNDKLEKEEDDESLEEIVCDRIPEMTSTSSKKTGESQRSGATRVKDADVDREPLQADEHPQHDVPDEVVDEPKDPFLNTKAGPDDFPDNNVEHDDNFLENRRLSQDIESKQPEMTSDAAHDVVEDDDVAMIISITAEDEVEETGDGTRKEHSSLVVALELVEPPVTEDGRQDLINKDHYSVDDAPCQNSEGVGSISPRTKLIPKDVIDDLNRLKQENEDLKHRLAGKEYDLETLRNLTKASSEMIAQKDKEIYFLQSDLELMRSKIAEDQNKDIKIQELQEQLNLVVQSSREKDEKISQLEEEIQNLRTAGLHQDSRSAGELNQGHSQDLMVKSKTCLVM